MDIQVELEDVSSVKKLLRVEIPAETAQKELNRVAHDYRKYARLPGFRPGKAPVELVKRRYQKDIRQDVLQKLIPESYDQAVKEKGLQPLGQPNLENLDFEEGKPLVYQARFEVRPQIKLPEYKGLEAAAEEQAVTEEDVNQEIEKLREQQSRLISVEARPTEEGDYAVVDLNGEHAEEPEGHAHEPIVEENVVFRVGDEQTLQAFNDTLKGMQVGDERTAEVDYPSDYPNKKLAGHRIRFQIRLNDIKKKELPEVNDEFAKDLGEFETLDQLKQKVRSELEANRQKNRENELKNRLIDKLIQSTDFEAPEILVEDRIDEKLRNLAYNIAAQGVDPSKANVDWSKVRAQIRPEAEKDVRAAIILEEISRQEGLEASSEELEEEVGRVANSMNQPVEKVRQYFQQENRLDDLRHQIVTRKAVNWVYENAKVSL